jgi:hypothetical protein
MIVAQYSVHALAGLEPDYGIHFPNIRSPEGWQKNNVRSSGVIVAAQRPAFPERLSNRLHKHSGESLNPPWQTSLLFYTTSLSAYEIFLLL